MGESQVGAHTSLPERCESLSHSQWWISFFLPSLLFFRWPWISGRLSKVLLRTEKGKQQKGKSVAKKKENKQVQSRRADRRPRVSQSHRLWHQSFQGKARLIWWAPWHPGKRKGDCYITGRNPASSTSTTPWIPANLKSQPSKVSTSKKGRLSANLQPINTEVVHHVAFLAPTADFKQKHLGTHLNLEA